MPDARLSNYRLERLLGSGGMGSVYLARDLALDRPVAIKFISPEKAGDEGARRRLIREARAAAALDHPNICAVYQVIVEADGRACIVMQYVEGETLAARLRTGPLEARLALSVTCDLAEALSAAHKRGIVHRDLKPQNVVITNDRRAKLLDFGIARVSELTTSTGGDDTATSLTVPGVFVGTPPYMSPEQFQQQPLDGRSDLFSLGALFFECLTGRRAFDGRSQIEIFTQVLHHHPPVVSALRPELTDRYDEVCRRLLAKHPDDRFRSAEELLGALRLLSPDTARSGAAPSVDAAPAGGGRRVDRRVLLSVAASALIVAAIGVWRWKGAQTGSSGGELYRVGTEYVRSGAYDSGRRALLASVARVPSTAAYVRLAEANTELDEVELAKDNIIKASAFSGISTNDGLRIQAVRALALREMDEAVGAYRQLAAASPDDASAWLDLGRAQEAAAPADARLSYDTAIKVDEEYAAAYLRRASLFALEGRRDDAMRDFDMAEQLYTTRSNVEGRAEVLLRRGGYLNSLGQLDVAKRELQAALTLAAGSRSQAVRAQLQLSSVTASEGRFTEAEQMAIAAIETARRNDLDATAADGLIDLANTLYLAKRTTEADAHLKSALELARKRGAIRVIARGTVQQAAVMLGTGRTVEGVSLAEEAVASVRRHRYRRFELKALNIISRGRETLGQFPEARQAAKEVLRVATEIKDDVQVAEALESLAGQSNALGLLPEAHGYRLEAEGIHRAQKDFAILAFDLTNRADLLIRLGRATEAATLLAEIDTGVAKGVDSYKSRVRRAQSLRAVSAAIQGRHAEAARIATVLRSADATDTFGRLADRLIEYSDASMGRRITPKPFPEREKLISPTTREIRYWTLAACLAAGDGERTLSAVTATLNDEHAGVSFEFEWRVAAIGAAAARGRDAAAARALTARAEAALSRLREVWKDDTSRYEARPDLKALRRKAGLNSRS